MGSQQDLQELLRLLTVTRKLPMMQAMGQVKALQAAKLFRYVPHAFVPHRPGLISASPSHSSSSPPTCSIQQIAESDAATVESAIEDETSAKALQSACKAVLKKGAVGGNKRAGSGAVDDRSAKRYKASASNDLFGGATEMSPQELESLLELPLSLDESAIADAVVETNRAPLVLAFAVELIRYTMPEQPLSSRLSLGQAVLSANSRSRAVSLGLDHGPSADEEGWGQGQPQVSIMGREVSVLKRGGYRWSGEEEVGASETPSPSTIQPSPAASTTWAASQPLSLKKSTFIARAAHMTVPSHKDALLRSLFAAKPHLETATHNAWAYRVKPSADAGPSARPREASFDDGETGCGDLVLRMMRELDAVDTLVVLSRWFGGVMLGPDRWRLMRNCVTSALAERLRKTGAEAALGGEAVWGLDLEAVRAKTTSRAGSQSQSHGTGVVGMQTHRPEVARNYLLKSFATAQDETSEAKSSRKAHKAQDDEKKANLGLVLGAIRLLLDSWSDHLTTAELDKRAWGWYSSVRPSVDAGPAGWGAKGKLKLHDILKLRRSP